MEICHGKMVPDDPFTVQHMSFDMSEIFGKLCRGRSLYR